MAQGTDDPSVIQSLAVTAEDVVVAAETWYQRGERVVFRATPPFSGRMRARLHVPDTDAESGTASPGRTSTDGDAAVLEATEGAGTGEANEGTPRPVHVDVTDLLSESAPAYPRPGDAEDELRADPSVEYTVDRHRARHERALDAWREAIPDHVVDRTTAMSTRGELTVAVTVLGRK